jgi:hypothetical protein
MSKARTGIWRNHSVRFQISFCTEITYAAISSRLTKLSAKTDVLTLRLETAVATYTLIVS